ncbi:HNH endonuclease [Pseudomonas sp. URMO17WK12:I11]|uniref:HNH endonuclease n=1 Tax=Pseudomonas sp. URMO17WK12:I11 TaxID=1283291 RepID=UPI00211493A7|nr:HNH endonuclease [Pseudomonas sp. URMO17WK12:I11]
MEPKSKDQWRDFLATAMETAPPITPARAIRQVSTQEYVQALRLIEPEITDKQRRMLIGHAQAKEHALTMSELAEQVGFPSYSAANLQYGLLAAKLADSLAIARPTFLVYVIARFDADPETSHSRAYMYPELVVALRELGWLEVPACSRSGAAARTLSNARPSIQEVLSVLLSAGFQRPQQSGLKVVRMEHPRLGEALFVKQSTSLESRLQAPLVLHPRYKERLQQILAIAGVERGSTSYYHNSNLRGFPKRRNGGETDIAYGIDLGFSHAAALEQTLEYLLGAKTAVAVALPASQELVEAEVLDLSEQAHSDTERDALIKARIGQSGYRDDLLAYWGGCAVTDCCVPELLRASHIKPWHAASPAERLDPFNGLLLTPNLDLAFDRGLISFDDHGQILLGEDLDPDSARALNITPSLRLRQIEPQHRGYLAWHREHLFRK